MPETVHEVAIYLDRFHNLDLFEQGWYQIKITTRWEDSRKETIGSPARVVQYESPVSLTNGTIGVWKIDDADNSFSTRPFQIKYARQNVLLPAMISFYFPLGKDEIPSTSAVLLKFELMHAPIQDKCPEFQDVPDTSPVSVHEFRIPPKALLGLHSYCPVHFDAFHAVLVDLSVHIVFLRDGVLTPSLKEVGPNLIELVKSLSTSCDVLLGELRNIAKETGQEIEDLSNPDSIFDINKLALVTEKSALRLEGGEVVGDFLSDLKKSNGFVDLHSDAKCQSLSNQELLYTFYLLGYRVSSLWNIFLKFHRVHSAKVMEYLRNCWASDRKSEWSIWMVHSKADIPHRYLKSGANKAFDLSVPGKVSLSKKLSNDPAQNAITRAELHRRSIAQMNINNCSIQDMQIYGNPLCIPIVLLEQHVMNVPVAQSSNSSPLDTLNEETIAGGSQEYRDTSLPLLRGTTLPKSNWTLKIVVFVHGFQGHHLDLRLVRNQWLLIDPTTEFLMSEANEEKTSGDFREMGKRLAEEVNSFLIRKSNVASKFGGCKDIKLSFVGHSIGNIIIRSALTGIFHMLSTQLYFSLIYRFLTTIYCFLESVMQPFLKHLYTFMSLSGPHLGYWYSSNSLFNSGLWLLKKFKGAQFIHQLTFTDNPNLQKTFFYKLCEQKTLERFRNIILLSSPQDGYVPYHSARIELCPASSCDNSKKAQVFVEMLNNCLDQIRAPSSDCRTFMRCDVNFDMSSQGRSLNTIIGRAAHIEFLETDSYIRFIMWSYPELFQ